MIQDALWVDEDHREECDLVIKVLQDNGVEFRTWDVAKMDPTDMDGDPPLLITGVGVFVGLDSISGYARMSKSLLLENS